MGLFLWSTFRLTAGLGFTERADWQANCLQSQSCMPEYECKSFVDNEPTRDGSWPICLDGFRHNKCLIYSFGVANDWSFDQEMGAFGCEVHSFDPTVQLPEDLAPNVTFHQWGLKGKETGFSRGAEQLYGPQLGPLYTLHEIRHRLGHHSHLSVLKMDCEGCEWGFFADFKANPSILPDQIAVEFHFSEAFGIVGQKSMQDVSDAFQVLSQGEYEKFFWHENPGEGPIIDILLKAGFRPNSCCREMVFRRRQLILQDHTNGTLLKKVGAHLQNHFRWPRL